MNAHKRATNNEKDASKTNLYYSNLTGLHSASNSAEMNTLIPFGPGPLEEITMIVMMVMHEALTGSDARRSGSPVAFVE